ncbi:TPA: hypothetical protein JBA24_14395 [Legionella pneumophila]|nr:hypothetical protein [Legionella pneumophila]HAT8712374.1 hypothetical protein [Legionella pneumophila]
MSKNDSSILAWLSGNWLSLCMLVLAGFSAWYSYQANSDASQQRIVEQVTKQVTLEKEVDYHKQQIKELEDKMSEMNKMYISLNEKISGLAGKAQVIDRQLMKSTLKALMLTGKTYQESIRYWNSPLKNINPANPKYDP